MRCKGIFGSYGNTEMPVVIDGEKNARRGTRAPREMTSRKKEKVRGTSTDVMQGEVWTSF